MEWITSILQTERKILEWTWLLFRDDSQTRSLFLRRFAGPPSLVHAVNSHAIPQDKTAPTVSVIYLWFLRGCQGFAPTSPRLPVHTVVSVPHIRGVVQPCNLKESEQLNHEWTMVNSCNLNYRPLERKSPWPLVYPSGSLMRMVACSILESAHLYI